MKIVEQLSTLRWYQSSMGGRLGWFWSANKVEQRIADVWHTIVEEALTAVTMVSDHPPLTMKLLQPSMLRFSTERCRF